MPSAANRAGEREDLERLRDTTARLIQLLVQEKVITQQKAEALMQEAKLGGVAVTQPGISAATTTPAAEPGAVATAPPTAAKNVVRVPYVPEIVKNEIRDQIRDEVIAQAKAEHWAEPNAIPEWVDRIALEGDVRLRYQGNFFQPSNVPAAIYQTITGNTNVQNTTNDEAWWRIRARLGVRAHIADGLDAKVSVATGNAQNPISLNQDFANYFSGYSVQLDNAFVRYAPRDWATVTAGRFPKPFFSSELVWWDDLVMDGAAITAKPKLTNDITGFVTGGGFLVQSPQSSPVTPDPKTKFLLGVQGGVDWSLGSRTKLKLGVAYYDFQNLEGQRNTIDAPNAFDWTAPKFTQKGNALFDSNFGTGNAARYALASKFKELNLTAALDLAQFDPYVVRVSGDIVKNLGFDREEIFQRTGLQVPEGRDHGYQAQVQFGSADIQKFNDWQVFLMYRHLQGDAVLDAFNDPDFHQGGTNTKGYTLGVRYGLASNAWLRFRWMSADEIDGPPLAIDVLQMDLNVRF